ncbi:multicopper oxidase domain-containing protein [Nocardia sp. IBHARD005]|uniref:multicopper oxidase domain-containing protein n=1 Tax=Nocardia sp. IBHARD005 TaxID=3457765 RepID=UPI004058B50A
MSRIDTTVTRGTTETWVVHIIDGMPHNFHVHDVQFRVLDYDGAPPPSELAGAEDTIFLRPNTAATLACASTGLLIRRHRTCTTATCCGTRMSG